MKRTRKQRREEREAKTPAWYSIWYLRWGQGGGRPSGCQLGRAAPPPQVPIFKGTSQPTWKGVPLPPSLPPLTNGTAEHDSGMCSGKTEAQTAAKSQTGEMERDGSSCLFPTLPTPLTHQALIDKILGKVDQHQGGDVAQQALEELAGVSGRLGAVTTCRAHVVAAAQTLNTIHLSWRDRFQLEPAGEHRGRDTGSQKLRTWPGAPACQKHQPTEQCGHT